VINKGNTEEDLLATIEQVLSAGWRLVKLYFMVGLPTEQEEDLEGIASLCQKASESPGAPKARPDQPERLHLYPKAHTPFQWEPQGSIEEVQKKHQFLRKNLDDRV